MGSPHEDFDLITRTKRRSISERHKLTPRCVPPPEGDPRGRTRWDYVGTAACSILCSCIIPLPNNDPTVHRMALACLTSVQRQVLVACIDHWILSPPGDDYC